MCSEPGGDATKTSATTNVGLDRSKFCRYPPDHKYSTKIGAGMSSISIRKPEFRLLLGYPDVVLTRVGVEEPVGSATPGSEGFAADLRRVASEVLRAGGRLTVVLPASEVWRGQLEPGGRAPRAEWQAARTRAAAALGVAPEALRTFVGRRSPGGLVPAAAVRRSTLAEVRALLASVGLRPAAIVGAGTFEGFGAPPRLSESWTTTVGRRRALAGAGGLAAAAVALMMMGLGPDDEAAPAPPVVPAVVAQATPATPVHSTPAPVQATNVAAKPPAKPAPLRLARAAPPLHRPETPLVPAGATMQSVATLGTRSVPMVIVEEKEGPVAEIRLAELSNPSGPLTDIAIPLHRPVARTNAVTSADIGPVPALRPEPRPGAALPARTAARAVTPADVADGRPMPRPAVELVRVASLGDQVSDAVVAASVLNPLARPERLHTAAPRPIPEPVAPKPVAPKPTAPKAVAAVAPRPVVAPAPKPVVATPKIAAAPVRPAPVVRAAPEPVVQRVVRAAPAPAKPVAAPVAEPVRVAVAQPAPSVRQRHGMAAGFLALGRQSTPNELALVGIFGGSEGRSALIQMPNGKIQKVSAGDRVQGMQVAAIGTDSVRVTDGRKVTLLDLPD
jgi:hypothetical protein